MSNYMLTLSLSHPMKLQLIAFSHTLIHIHTHTKHSSVSCHSAVTPLGRFGETDPPTGINPSHKHLTTINFPYTSIDIQDIGYYLTLWNRSHWVTIADQISSVLEWKRPRQFAVHQWLLPSLASSSLSTSYSRRSLIMGNVDYTKNAIVKQISNVRLKEFRVTCVRVCHIRIAKECFDNDNKKK